MCINITIWMPFGFMNLETIKPPHKRHSFIQVRLVITNPAKLLD